jgi:hypothetical protein
MSLRTLSSRSEQGNATHTIEANNEAATKLLPADVQKTMFDAVVLNGKSAALWVRDCSQSDMELDIRFATLSNSIVTGEHWTFHRLISVPRDPAPDTDEYEMIQDFYKIMYREAGWCGVSKENFSAYLKEEGLL